MFFFFHFLSFPFLGVRLRAVMSRVLPGSAISHLTHRPLISSQLLCTTALHPYLIKHTRPFNTSEDNCSLHFLLVKFVAGKWAKKSSIVIEQNIFAVLTLSASQMQKTHTSLKDHFILISWPVPQISPRTHQFCIALVKSVHALLQVWFCWMNMNNPFLLFFHQFHWSFVFTSLTHCVSFVHAL